MSEHEDQVLKAEATIRELAKSLSSLDEQNTLVEEAKNALGSAERALSELAESIATISQPVLDSVGQLQESMRRASMRSWLSLALAAATLVLVAATFLLR